MHRFNRWYLLVSLAFSLAMPLVHFSINEASTPLLQQNYFVLIDNYPFTTGSTQGTIAEGPRGVDVATGLLGIYLVTVIVLLTRFCRNLYSLLAVARTRPNVPFQKATLVLLKDRTASYSFLHYIFVNEEDHLSGCIEPEIMTHELAHVRQRHSLDMLLIELLQVAMWFNPLLIIYKRCIQLNHEFLADDEVARMHRNVKAYQFLLLEKSGLNNQPQFTSSFNYHVTKRRLIMLTHTSHPFRTAVKKIALLPVLALMVVLFSSRNFTLAQPAQKETPPLGPQSAGIVSEKMLGNVPYTKEGLSSAAFNEYAAIAKKYTPEVDAKRRPLNNSTISMPEAEKLRAEELFKKMSRSQQLTQHMVFLPPLGPSKPEPPTKAQFDRWKSSKDYAVWIDEKRVTDLAGYEASDFPLFLFDRAWGEEKKQFKYKISLWSKENFKKMNDRRKKEKHLMLAFFWRGDPRNPDSLSWPKQKPSPRLSR